MNGGKPLVKRVAFFLIGAAILLLSFPGLLSAAPTASGKAVYWVPVDQEVERGLSRFLERALSEAEEAQAEAVVLEIDTLGGEVGAALEIGKSIRRSRVPVNDRSEEHTSELQSRENLVYRLLLVKKKDVKHQTRI